MQEQNILFFHDWYGKLLTNHKTVYFGDLYKKTSKLNKFLIKYLPFYKSIYQFFICKKFKMTVFPSETMSFGLLVLFYVFGYKNVILLEFLAPIYSTKIKIKYLIYKITFPKVVRALQCMSLHDLEFFKQKFGNTVNLQYIPWASIDNFNEFEKQLNLQILKFETNNQKNKILASGYNSVDWETIIRASENQNWDLTLVCSIKEKDKILALKKIYNAKCKILNDIAWDEYKLYLKNSDIFLLISIETNRSVGHIRIMNAISNGIILVATYVKGLKEYLNNKNAILIEEKNYMQLRNEVNKLITNPNKCIKILKNSFATSKKYTLQQYRNNIVNLIENNITF